MPIGELTIRAGIPRALLVLVCLLAAGAGSAQAAGLRWSAPTRLTAAPGSLDHALQTMACPAASLCIAGDDSGNVVESADPTGGAGAWRVIEQVDPGAGIAGVSCPSPSLCVAVGSTGDVAVSTRPTAAWRPHSRILPPGDGFTAVSCPTRRLCAAPDRRGNVAVTSDPLSGRWRLVRALTRRLDWLVSVSCPSVSLCVAIDGRSEVVVHSVRPLGDAAAWHTVRIATQAGQEGPPYAPESIACPSRSLCVAAGIDGPASTAFIATATRPAGGRSAWRVSTRLPHGTGYINGLSCPSAHFCAAAGDEFGSPGLTTTDPAAGATSWTPSVGPRGGALGIACAGASLCVLFDGTGDVLTSTSPASAAASSWPLANVDAYNSLTTVACPSAGLCLAGGSEPDVLATADPAAGPWTAEPIGISPGRLACASASVCVAGDLRGGNVAATTTPLSGGWTTADTNSYLIDGGMAIRILACAPGPFCLAGPLEVQTDADSSGTSSLTSTNPAGGRNAWHYGSSFIEGGPNGGPRAAQGELSALACPSAGVCVAGDLVGGILASSHLSRLPWPYRRVDGSAAINGLACPRTNLCIGVDSAGRVLSSTAPLAARWRSVSIEPGVALKAVACAGPRFCVAVDGAGHAFVSTRPTAGASSWVRSPRIDGDLTAVACPTRSLCVAVDSQGGEIVGRR